jgi:hypothetical protein
MTIPPHTILSEKAIELEQGIGMMVRKALAATRRESHLCTECGSQQEADATRVNLRGSGKRPPE